MILMRGGLYNYAFVVLYVSLRSVDIVQLLGHLDLKLVHICMLLIELFQLISPLKRPYLPHLHALQLLPLLQYLLKPVFLVQPFECELALLVELLRDHGAGAFVAFESIVEGFADRFGQLLIRVFFLLDILVYSFIFFEDLLQAFGMLTLTKGGVLPQSILLVCAQTACTGFDFSFIVFSIGLSSTHLLTERPEAAINLLIFYLSYFTSFLPQVLFLLNLMLQVLIVPLRVLLILALLLLPHLGHLLKLQIIPAQRPLVQLSQVVVEVGLGNGLLLGVLLSNFVQHFFVGLQLALGLLLVLEVLENLKLHEFNFLFGELHCVLSNLLKTLYSGLLFIHSNLGLQQLLGHLEYVLGG
ncbi:hypothetical protein FGO68_gene1726 [Halteria grandinella]|uniref:Uncharacterized protein n=1 Tax=Halteria grandinella TaxID=5974 RepID=A0A8J8NCR4_HALGN|nr:hypothetical protein FGO68_gene1726 [Halteria grandinella]